jgi:hypothetical protein
MRIPANIIACCVVALCLFACNSAPTSSSANPSSPDSATASLTGFAFVDSSVAGQGAGAKLPAGTKIYPSGSQITGTEGCPTNQYKTDGLPVVVIDYSGRPTAGSVTVVRHPATGGTFTNSLGDFRACAQLHLKCPKEINDPRLPADLPAVCLQRRSSVKCTRCAGYFVHHRPHHLPL